MVRHSQIVFPFGTLRGALNNCTVEPDLPDGSQHGRDRWVTRVEDIADGFSFNVILGNGFSSTLPESEFNHDELELAVRFRNERSKRSVVLDRWEVEQAPCRKRFTNLPTGVNFQIDLSLIARRRISRTRAPDVLPGSLIANRSFTFNTSGFRFPMEYANFGERGWPPDALWWYELDGESIHLPADDCLKIYVNDKLRSLFEGTTKERRITREVFTETLGSSIFAAIAREVIVQGLINDDSVEGLAGSIVAALTADGRSKVADWAGFASDDPTYFLSRMADRLKTAENLRSVQ